MMKRAARKIWPMWVELEAIILIGSIVTVAVYVWMFYPKGIATPYGIIISIALAAILAFYRTNRAYGLIAAIFSALAVALLSAFLTMFGLLNIFGT